MFNLFYNKSIAYELPHKSDRITLTNTNRVNVTNRLRLQPYETLVLEL